MGAVVCLIAGFVLLVWGADKFVEGASALALKLGVSSLIVGLTVVAFGTSAPELAVSLVAGLQGSNEIAIGNVLGSNIFNLLIVVGCSALVAPLVIERELLNRDWIWSIVGTILLVYLIGFDWEISLIDGFILLAVFAVVMFVQIRSALKGKEKNEKPEIQIKDDKTRNGKVILFMIVGLVGIIIGGQLAVNGATSIARMFHISETIIGLTIVAIGTSLPELVTSVVATKKGETNIAIGNVIGSNIFNIFFILGVSAVCNPIQVSTVSILDTILLFVISMILFIPAYKNKVNRKTGILMIGIYVVYVAWILVR